MPVRPPDDPTGSDRRRPSARRQRLAPGVTGAMLHAWKRLRAIDGLLEGPSVFDDTDAVRAFYVDGTQVVNLRGRDELELRLTKPVIRAERSRLREDPRVELRRNPSDWITVRVATRPDATLVVELAEMAAKAHLPPPGATVRPPPDDAELARRRRFH